MMGVRRTAMLGVATLVLAAAAGAQGGAATPIAAQQGGSWSIVVPDTIVEGEAFEVSAGFSGPGGGLPALSLHVVPGSESLVEVTSEKTVYFPSSFISVDNTWKLTALEAGTAELRAYINYEKAFPCEPEPDCIPVMSFVGEEETFSVEILPAEEAPPQPGDVNEDGVVDSRDALLILQYDAGLIEEPAMADLNDDGVVDSRDALLILQYDAGMIESLG